MAHLLFRWQFSKYADDDLEAKLVNSCYYAGRYVPKFEAPMFHFHRLLHAAMNNTDR